MKKRILSGMNKIGLCVLLTLGLFGCSTIKEISFTSQNDTVSIGDEINLTYITNPSDAKTDDISVTLSDSSFVNQENDRYISIKEGILTVSLIYKDEVYDTKTIEIQPIFCKEVYAEDVSLGVGRDNMVNVQFYPTDCTHKEYSLSSSDESIVKTFGSKIIAVAEGEASVTIESVDGAESSFIVNVYPVEPDKISISNVKDKYVVGDKGTVKVIYDPEDVTYKDVTFRSSNSGILSIEQNGTITAKYPGEATITAVYSDEIYASKTVTVKYPSVQSITASSYYSTLYVGNKTKINVSFDPVKVDDYTVRFSSNNSKVATVDENGVVTGVTAGTAIITAKSSNNRTSKVEIEIKDQPVQIITRNVDPGTGSGTMVWIPRTGSKYHYSQYCSNMKNPSYVTLEYAIAHGYAACKKCAGG